jgi:hypothetical protein
VWQISGPPTIFMTGNVVANLFHIPFWKIGSLPIGQTKMDRFENFSTISYTISKLKGGQFNGKNANSCILGPILWAVLNILGGSTNRPRIVQFWNSWTISYTKSKFKGGPFYEKNCQLMFLKPHFGGRFEKWGVRSANRPTMNRFANFSTLFFTKSKF